MLKCVCGSLKERGFDGVLMWHLRWSDVGDNAETCDLHGLSGHVPMAWFSTQYGHYLGPITNMPVLLFLGVCRVVTNQSPHWVEWHKVILMQADDILWSVLYHE